MSWRTAAAIAAAACGVAGAAAATPPPASGVPVVELPAAPFAAAEVMGTVTHPAVREASGLAPSRRRPDLLWLLNDSRNPPVLYAVTTGGVAVCDARLAGVRNVDWEDLASFERDGVAYLLVADVGDNGAKRTNCVLHVVVEPDLSVPGAPATQAVPVAWSVPLVYEDGPRDCEAVAVDAAGGCALLLSKRSRPPVLYSVPLAAPAAGAPPAVARRMAAVNSLPPPTALDLAAPGGSYASQPTAMDLSAAGDALAVLTYKNAYYFRRLPDQSWAEALARPPLPVTLPDMSLPLLRGREAMCFTAAGDLVVTREGASPPLCRLRATPNR